MNKENGGLNCTFSSFVMAAIIAALAIVVFRSFTELSWPGSIFLGGLIFAFAGVLFNYLFCRELPALGEVETPKPAERPKAEAAPEEPTAKATVTEPEPAPAPAPAPESEPEPEPEASPAPAATGEALRPVALDGPRDGGADNLKEIKGIGPKLEKLFNSLGFYHCDQIANWSAEEVAWVDENLEGFKGRVTRDDWVAQAKILASGGGNGVFKAR